MQFVSSISLLLAAAITATYYSRRRAANMIADLTIITAFALLALLWQNLVLAPAPLVIPSGDGGNVASIIAATLYPDRMTTDPVFSNPQNFSFYITITRPWVALNQVFTNDLGRAYVTMQIVVIFVQMTGFYLLGKRLFGGCFWPLVLAMVSVPPVFIFNGELWGNLPVPLTRSVFGAIFPFLLLVALPPFQSWRPLLTMAFCGLSTYIHPVSAPSVAMALWLAMLAVPPADGYRIKKFLIMLLAGICFMLMAVPFALIFVPSMVKISSPAVGAIADMARNTNGQQYYDALLAVKIALANGGNNPFEGWGWLYVFWIAAFLFLLAGLRIKDDGKRLFFLVFFFAMILSSAGVALLDQAIARFHNSGPVAIDIIRNLRFLIPILSIGFVWLLAEMEHRFRNRKFTLFTSTVAGIIIVAIWWAIFPTPIASLVLRSINSAIVTPARDDADLRAVMVRLRSEPAGSMVLPLPVNGFEAEALAIRYAALQPVLFLRKDLNFLLYSGSASLERWGRFEEVLTGIENRNAAEIEGVLKGLKGGDQPRFLMIDTRKSTPMLTEAVANLGKLAFVAGNWHLIEFNPPAEGE